MWAGDLSSDRPDCVLMALSLSSATAAFLVSLYIKDVWLGAQRPDTLLTHVQMVLDASEDMEGGDEEAVVRLCKDIAAAIPDT